MHYINWYYLSIYYLSLFDSSLCSSQPTTANHSYEMLGSAFQQINCTTPTHKAQLTACNLLHNLLRFLIALEHWQTLGFQDLKLLAFWRQFHAFVHTEHYLQQKVCHTSTSTKSNWSLQHKGIMSKKLFSRKSQRYKGCMSYYVDIQHLCFWHWHVLWLIDRITIFCKDENKPSTTV